MKKMTALLLVMMMLLSSMMVVSANERVMYGDLNSDSEVNIRDAVLLSKHLAGEVKVEWINGEAADVDGNGLIDQEDYTLLLRRIAGLTYTDNGDIDEIPANIGQDALKHVEYLTETIGPRVAATAEEREAALYIKDQFNNYGYDDAYLQEFEIKSIEGTVTIVSQDNIVLDSSPMTNAGISQAEGVLGDVVYASTGLVPEDFTPEMNGKVALIQRGGGTFATKAKNAVDAGAVGVIIFNNRDGDVINRGTLGTYSCPVPVVSTSQVLGEKLLADLEIGTQTINMKLVEKIDISQNTVAVKEATNGDANAPIVYVIGHYDSVPKAPGANDNASGTSLVLEFAQYFSDAETNKEIRFIAAGAEEVGILGSAYYANNLTQAEVDRSIACFNMDMIATSYADCVNMGMVTIDGYSNIVTNSARFASETMADETTYVLRKGGRSDHQSFHDVGIPAANFIRYDNNNNLEPYYHKPEDNIGQNISVPRLDEAGKVILTALKYVVEDTPVQAQLMMAESFDSTPEPVIEEAVYDDGAEQE